MTFGDRFAENLIGYRNRAGLTREGLGHRASVHSTTIELLESGRRAPKLDTLVRLAGALSITPGDLVEGITWRPGYVGDGPGRYQLSPDDSTAARSRAEP